MLSFVSSQAIIRVTDVADEEPSPPLEVDMRTFSELARAQPLEHSLVVGGKEKFRVNGLDGEHQPAGRRSNAPVAGASSHITALRRADDDTDEDDAVVSCVNASEDEDDPAEAQGSTLACSLPSQTQTTAVVAELDTEEDLKDECEWCSHPEWFEAAKSNEAKKKKKK